MNSQRTALSLRRAVTLMRPNTTMSIRRGGNASHGDHHDHHDHRVFHPPYNPGGAPFFIYAGCLFGGLGTVYIAYELQMWKFRGGK